MRLYRKVIRVRAEDSPNVRKAQELLRDNPDIDRRELPRLSLVVPGVITWDDYQKRRATWDKVRQCVGLDGEFYEGGEVLLFPPEWLNEAERLADALRGRPRKAEAMGIDTGEGGDPTAWAIIDRLGVIELVARQTPDTNDIPGATIALGRKHNVPPENWVFDRGGGGKEHADRLRAQGFNVRTVAFGEAVMPDPRRGLTPFSERVENKEERYVYVNRRAEMFGELSQLLDPTRPLPGFSDSFAIPSEYTELRHQLSVFPKLYDREGRMFLPPKNKKDPNSKIKTLVEMIGHSPDESDALVLAVHGMLHKARRVVAGAV